MLIREAIDWPPSGCVGGYSGSEPLPFDPEIATLGGVKARGGSVRIEVLQGHRSWSCTVLVPESCALEALVEALKRTRGMTLSQAGAMEVA